MKLRELWGIPIPGTEKAVGLKKVSKEFSREFSKGFCPRRFLNPAPNSGGGSLAASLG